MNYKDVLGNYKVYVFTYVNEKDAHKCFIIGEHTAACFTAFDKEISTMFSMIDYDKIEQEEITIDKWAKDEMEEDYFMGRKMKLNEFILLCDFNGYELPLVWDASETL